MSKTSVLNPATGQIELPALGLNSKYYPKPIQTVRLIGSDQAAKFQQSEGKLVLGVPNSRPSRYAATFEIKGAL